MDRHASSRKGVEATLSIAFRTSGAGLCRASAALRRPGIGDEEAAQVQIRKSVQAAQEYIAVEAGSDG